MAPRDGEDDEDLKAALTRAPKKVRKEVNQLRATVDKLANDKNQLTSYVGALEARDGSGSGRHRGQPSLRAQPVDNSVAEESPNLYMATHATLRDLKDRGHAYVFNAGLWLINEEPRSPNSTFKKSVPRKFKASTESRFANVQNLEICQVLDVIEALGPHEPYRHEPWVEAEFHEGMKEQRSNWISRCRGGARLLIFGKDDATHLDTPRSREDAFKDAIGWKPDVKKKKKGMGGGYATLAVPAIHEDGQLLPDGSCNPDTIFRARRLILLWAACIMGEKTAEAWAQGHKARPGLNMLRKLGLSRTEPTHIATASILLRWTMSEDEVFQPTGDRTYHHWWRDYNTYLKYLITGLEQRRKSVLRLFLFWDEAFFPHNIDNSLGRGKMAEPASSLMESDEALAAMAALQEGEQESSDEDEPMTVDDNGKSSADERRSPQTHQPQGGSTQRRSPRPSSPERAPTPGPSSRTQHSLVRKHGDGTPPAGEPPAKKKRQAPRHEEDSDSGEVLGGRKELDGDGSSSDR